MIKAHHLYTHEDPYLGNSQVSDVLLLRMRINTRGYLSVLSPTNAALFPIIRKAEIPHEWVLQLTSFHEQLWDIKLFKW